MLPLIVSTRALFPYGEVCMVTFIAKLNNLQVWSTEVGNTYLDSYTKGKVHIVAGPEFASMDLEQGHILLLIYPALYGLNQVKRTEMV
jgi:hypothetical protein